MRNLILSTVVLAAVVVLVAGPAFAKTTKFIKGQADLMMPDPSDPNLVVPGTDGINDTSDWMWTDANNWNNGVPADGDTIQFGRYNWNRPVGLNTNGADLNLPHAQVSGSYNGDYMTWYDGGFMTPVYKTPDPGDNNPPIGNMLLNGKADFTYDTNTYGSLVEAANASPTLVINKINYSKQHVVTWMMPIDANQINDGGASYDFYGDVNIRQSATLNGRGDTSDTLNFYGELDASSATMTLKTRTTVNTRNTATIGTVNISDPSAKFHVMDANGSGGAGAVINVNSGTLTFDVAQNTFPAQINVAAYSVLSGDMTGATYGTNTILAEDAVLALTANEPVDTTPGVYDAMYWKGVTDKSNDAVTSAADDGNSVYKGVAVGTWVSGDMNGTIQAPAGVSELSVLVAGGQTRFRSNSEMLLTDTGTTQTANIQVAAGSKMYMDNDYINRNSAADPNLQVTTFNVTGAGGGDTTVHANRGVDVGQTFIINNGVFYSNTNGVASSGTVVIKGDSAFQIGNDYALKYDATTKYEFEEGAAFYGSDNLRKALDLNSISVTFGADANGQIHIQGGTNLIWDTGWNKTLEADTNHDGTYTAAEFADSNMQKIISNSNISMVNNNAYRFAGYGLHLGDGKYLLLERNIRADGTTYVGADAGASTVGIATDVNAYCEAPFDANGATVVIGSDTPLTFFNDNTNTWHNRDTKIATGEVRLTGGLLNASLVQIKSGRLDLGSAQDLSGTDVEIDADGTLETSAAVTLGTVSGSGTIAGGANLTFDTIAPGASIGELTANALTFADGASYDWQVLDGNAVAGVNYDTITVNGNVDILGLLNFNIEDLGASLSGDEEFIVLTATGNLDGDFDGDGILQSVNFTGKDGVLTKVDNGGDWDLVLTFASTSGDTNGDGVVDATDYIALKRNLGTGSGAGLAEGDLDGDGDVDWDDLAAMNTALNTAAGATIPEPATMGLLALGGLAVIRRRRK